MRRFILGCYYVTLIALLISISCFVIGIASIMMRGSFSNEEIHGEAIVEEVSK